MHSNTRKSSKNALDRIYENFDSLVSHIKKVEYALRQDVLVVINRNVTTKAWLTGYYIVEYEQRGSDRAKYGEHLLQNLSKSLGGKSFSVTSLRSYRLFYMYYPELRTIIGKYLVQQFGKEKNNEMALVPDQIQQSVIAEMQIFSKQQSVIAESAGLEELSTIINISYDGLAMMRMNRKNF